MLRNYSNVLVIPKSGIFDLSKDKAIDESFLYRNGMRKQNIPLPVSEIPTKQSFEKSIPKAIFGGYLFDHYGHFMLESLSRMSAIQQMQSGTVVWIRLHSTNQKFRKWQEDIFRILRLDRFNHVILNEATHIEEVSLPMPGYRIRDYFSTTHRDFLGVIHTKKQSDRIWVSRSSEPDLTGWINELEIERELKKNGWTVFNPVEHTVTEQVRILASGSIVAGTAGSAFHSLMLAANVHSKIILFSRGAQEKINENFDTIAKTIGFEQDSIFPEQILLPRKSGGGQRFFVNEGQVHSALGISFNSSGMDLIRRIITEMGK